MQGERNARPMLDLYENLPKIKRLHKLEAK